MNFTLARKRPTEKRRGFIATLKKYWFVYMLVVPGLVFLLIFSYGPMYGILLAFKDYNLGLGIWGSPWAGLKYFKSFLADPYFWKVLKNTALINLYNIVFGFTFTIFFALMLNELRLRKTKRVVQTAVYLPYFLSWVIFAGLIKAFLDPQTGVVNNILASMGGSEIMFLTDKGLFRSVVVITNTIKEAGYDSILYLAAIAGVNPELYESARVDGANRWHMIRYITLPRIYPTVSVLLLLRVSRIFVSNFEQIYNLYSPMVYDTGDVVSTYIYRVGLEQAQYSLSTAVNLFTSVCGLVLLLVCNRLIEKTDVVGIF